MKSSKEQNHHSQSKDDDNSIRNWATENRGSQKKRISRDTIDKSIRINDKFNNSIL